MQLQYNPQANMFRKPVGYTDLGWQLDNHPVETACREKQHKTRQFDNSLYQYRCTDVITICDDCKYVYHTDMSD